MFGVDEQGKTYSLTAEGFRPFFYLLVSDKWKKKEKENFLRHLNSILGKKDSITRCKLIHRKKLYGFDGGKDHKFILLEFATSWKNYFILTTVRNRRVQLKIGGSYQIN